MLSKVAERMYWAARYVERAENTARIVNVYTSLLLDLPAQAGLGWQQLIDITGAEGLFRTLYRRADERNTLKFLLTEKGNPSSIASSLNSARENYRTVRDVIPTEAWREVNELNLFAISELRRAVSYRRRHEVLSSVIGGAQHITGLLAGTMSHGPAYQFLRMGRNLERADMSTRVIDVAAATLLRKTAEEQLENALWMNVLRTLSAYQMYRQNVRRRVNPADVLSYLLKDPEFPRTVLHCLNVIAGSMENLPRSKVPLKQIAKLTDQISRADAPALLGPELHGFIDELQLELAGLHEELVRTWFSPENAQKIKK